MDLGVAAGPAIGVNLRPASNDEHRWSGQTVRRRTLRGSRNLDRL